MKKARNFIGAVAIALAFMLSPAPVESAVVESTIEAPSLVPYLIFRTGRIIHVPQRVAEVLEELNIAVCGDLPG